MCSVGEGKQYALSYIHNTTGLLGRFVTKADEVAAVAEDALNGTAG